MWLVSWMKFKICKIEFLALTYLYVNSIRRVRCVSWRKVKQVHLCVMQVFTYHIIVSACACLCSVWAQTIGLCLPASYFSLVGWRRHSYTPTHTHLIYAQFLLASIKLQQFRDSKTGTIWSSLPASHFLPSPSSSTDNSERERSKQMNEKEKKNGLGGGDIKMNKTERGWEERGYGCGWVCVSVNRRWSAARMWPEVYGKTVLIVWRAGVDCIPPNYEHEAFTSSGGQVICNMQPDCQTAFCLKCSSTVANCDCLPFGAERVVSSGFLKA